MAASKKKAKPTQKDLVVMRFNRNQPIKFRTHRLSGGFDGVKLKRGFIPKKLKVTDKPGEIMCIYGVSYGTACVWLRILRGPNYMP
jgi:hypothetical protein